jgi:hypothetical protein
MTAIFESEDSDVAVYHETSFVDMVERLFQQFESRASLTEILAVVRDAREQLRGSPPTALPELTERLAAHRLSSLSEKPAGAPAA